MCANHASLDMRFRPPPLTDQISTPRLYRTYIGSLRYSDFLYVLIVFRQSADAHDRVRMHAATALLLRTMARNHLYAGDSDYWPDQIRTPAVFISSTNGDWVCHTLASTIGSVPYHDFRLSAYVLGTLRFSINSCMLPQRIFAETSMCGSDVSTVRTIQSVARRTAMAMRVSLPMHRLSTEPFSGCRMPIQWQYPSSSEDLSIITAIPPTPAGFTSVFIPSQNVCREQTCDSCRGNVYTANTILFAAMVPFTTRRYLHEWRSNWLHHRHLVLFSRGQALVTALLLTDSYLVSDSDIRDLAIATDDPFAAPTPLDALYFNLCEVIEVWHANTVSQRSSHQSSSLSMMNMAAGLLGDSPSPHHHDACRAVLPIRPVRSPGHVYL